MATLNQRLENLLINLRVIAKLVPGQRLLFKNKSVSIRNYYYVVTPLIRTVASESRTDVTAGLNELLEDIQRLYSDYINSSELQNPNVSEYDRETALAFIMSLNRLKIELPTVYETGNKGLNAAKETYADDPETSAKIDGVIDNLKLTSRKINITIQEMNKKYGLDSKITGTSTENKDTLNEHSRGKDTLNEHSRGKDTLNEHSKGKDTQNEHSKNKDTEDKTKPLTPPKNNTNAIESEEHSDEDA